jgi:ribonuclease HI
VDPSTREGHIAIYTDGSSDARGRLTRASWAWVDTMGTYATGAVRLEIDHEEYMGASTATNMAGELAALVQAFHRCKTLFAEDPRRIIHIRFDSQEAQAEATGKHRGREHLPLQRQAHLIWDELRLRHHLGVFRCHHLGGSL